jgi:hypothetical protein
VIVCKKLPEDLEDLPPETRAGIPKIVVNVTWGDPKTIGYNSRGGARALFVTRITHGFKDLVIAVLSFRLERLPKSCLGKG